MYHQHAAQAGGLAAGNELAQRLECRLTSQPMQVEARLWPHLTALQAGHDTLLYAITAIVQRVIGLCRGLVCFREWRNAFGHRLADATAG